MSNFYQTLFSRFFSLVLGSLIIVQGFFGSPFEADHPTNVVPEETFTDVLIGMLDWDYPDEGDRSSADSFPESESEPEKEKSESEDSKFYEIAERRHNSSMYLPERLTVNDIRALNSGNGKIPTPPPDFLRSFS